MGVGGVVREFFEWAIVQTIDKNTFLNSKSCCYKPWRGVHLSGKVCDCPRSQGEGDGGFRSLLGALFLQLRTTP